LVLGELLFPNSGQPGTPVSEVVVDKSWSPAIRSTADSTPDSEPSRAELCLHYRGADRVRLAASTKCYSTFLRASPADGPCTDTVDMEIVEEPSEVPDDATVIFSARGVSRAVLSRLKAWGGSFVEEKKGKRERVVFSLPKTLARRRESREPSVFPGGTEG
jgi:hypothetical protein